MIEVWKSIPENPCYEVSNHGRVRNAVTSSLITPRVSQFGYLRIHYTVNGKRVDRYIHRIVAEQFCNHPDGCNVVNHKDHNTTNNVASNLEWVTQRDNVLYAMFNGRMKKFPNAIPVIGFKNGETYYYRSATEAERNTGCSSKSILKCCKKIWKQTKGYTWQYAEVMI